MHIWYFYLYDILVAVVTAFVIQVIYNWLNSKDSLNDLGTSVRLYSNLSILGSIIIAAMVLPHSDNSVNELAYIIYLIPAFLRYATAELIFMIALSGLHRLFESPAENPSNRD